MISFGDSLDPRVTAMTEPQNKVEFEGIVHSAMQKVAEADGTVATVVVLVNFKPTEEAVPPSKLFLYSSSANGGMSLGDALQLSNNGIQLIQMSVNALGQSAIAHQIESTAPKLELAK